MRFDNLKNLEAFREIIQHGSATAAASSLGISQSAVSRLLAQFESELGFKLFHRSKGRLLPTPQALLLFDEVDLALQGMARMQVLADDICAVNAGRLRIAATPSFAEGPLVKLVASFLKLHPKIHINIDSRTRPATMNLIATRTADCGFAKLPLDHPSIRIQPLVSTTTVCAVPTGHHLAAGSGPLTAEMLRGEPLILIGHHGGDTRMRIDHAFRQAKVTPTVRLETRNVDVACALASEGVGIAIVNELLARGYANKGVLIRKFLPEIRQEYSFLVPADAPQSALTDTFYRHCQACIVGKSSVSRRRPVPPRNDCQDLT